MSDKSNLELEKLKEEIKKLKSENKLSDMKIYSGIFKDFLP